LQQSGCSRSMVCPGHASVCWRLAWRLCDPDPSPSPGGIPITRLAVGVLMTLLASLRLSPDLSRGFP
jgi:hypothetical protein